MKLPAHVVITRGESQVGTTYRLHIEDRASDATVVVEMSAEQFAAALTGVYTKADVDWHVVDLGKRREVKEEVVPCLWSSTPEEKRAACRPFEVDGWIAHYDDIGNHHRSTGKGFRVTFHRHV